MYGFRSQEINSSLQAFDADATPIRDMHNFTATPGYRLMTIDYHFPIFAQNQIAMDVSTISLIVSIAAFLAAFYAVFMLNEMKRTPVKSETSNETRSLQLQAYERLVLLAERIGLPSLVSRANQQFSGSAQEMRGLLLESIKQEYDYNATQQIYVSPVAWEALRNLKEQNMLIVNQVASTMPTDSSGFDLNKRLMEFAMTDKKGTMHQIVLEALNYEAKKIMK